VLSLDNLMSAVRAEANPAKRLDTLLRGIAAELRDTVGSQHRVNRVADWLETDRGEIGAAIWAANAKAAKSSSDG
jgi:hypothetical protein